MYDEENDITVTRQEYRTALESWESKRAPKIVAFVRDQTSVALRERRTAGIKDDQPSSYLKNPQFTSEFIAEVSRTEETKKATKREGPFPDSNWLAKFANFRELTDALRKTLNIRGSLQRAAVLENLRHELERNLRLTMHLRDGKPFYHHYLNTARDEVEINMENYDGQIALTFEQAKRADMYVLSGPPKPEVFSRRALSEAILTGVLLEYDTAQDTYEPSELQRALYRLQEELDVYTTRYEALDATIRPAVHGLWETVREQKSGGELSGSVLTSLFGLHDSEQDIVRITLGILRFLYDKTESIEVNSRPRSPIKGQDEKIAEETVTEERLREWLSEDNEWLRMGTVDASPEEKKAADEGWKAITKELGEEAAKAIVGNLMSGLRAGAADEVQRTIARIVAADPTALEAFRRVAKDRMDAGN